MANGNLEDKNSGNEYKFLLYGRDERGLRRASDDELGIKYVETSKGIFQPVDPQTNLKKYR